MFGEWAVLTLLTVAIMLTVNQAAPAADDAIDTRDRSPNYTIAVYYWPNFHLDPYHQSKKWKGWTEWVIVKNGKPLFEGHYQPKVPIWGYRDESDPKEMARSIDAMADVGIDALIFDWYRYDEKLNNGEMIEGALRDGFLKAPNRRRMKFALMWANHTYINCHPFEPGTSFHNAAVWHKGEVPRAAFDRHTQDAIDSYFKQPNYWLIDGKPYFSIYQLKTLIKGLGSAGETRAALDNFRQRTRAAGFKDLHLNLVDWSFDQSLAMVKGELMPGDPSRKIETQKDLMEALGADSSTWYTWVHHIPPIAGQNSQPQDAKIAGPLATSQLMENAVKAGLKVRDYTDWGNAALKREAERRKTIGIPLFPHVARGWDGSPRNYPKGMVIGNTPERFQYFLKKTKELVDQWPDAKGIVTINSWNEWVEGSYLEPDDKTGMQPLEAIYEVFGSK